MTNYGLLSIIPPLFAIGLAIITRNILVSLISGVFLGVIIINGWNPLSAFVSLISDFTFTEIVKGSQAQVLAIVFIIGGFVALVTAEKAFSSDSFSKLFSLCYLCAAARSLLATHMHRRRMPPGKNRRRLRGFGKD